MLGLFRKPVVELKLKNPKWICGRQLTWVDISIIGTCKVIISSATHHDWKPLKINSKREMSGSIAAPIGGTLTIVATRLMSKTITHFEVGHAEWIINAPEVPEFSIASVEPAKLLIQTWRNFVMQLKKTKPIHTRTSIRKVMLKPKFISMRVSKNKFNHREVISNDRSVHLQGE